MKLYLNLILLCLFTTFSFSAAAQKESRPSGRFTIHVLTFGQGEDLFSRFGHIALVADDHEERTRRVYNFGTFDFTDPALKWKYARGFLNYWVAVVSYPAMVEFYRELNRDIWMQTLNLSEEQAAQIAERLRVNALPENRVYAYRHYVDNCCTRIRNIIDETTDGALSRPGKAETTDRDFRYWTRRCLEGLPLFQSVILYSLGPAIDHPVTRWEEQFLPMVLMEDLDRAMTSDKQPLVYAKKHIARRVGPEIGVVVPTLDKVVIAVLVALLVLGLVIPAVWPRLRASARLLGGGLVAWGLFAGIGGLMLLLYWSATTHYDTHYNENLLVTPVTHLWLLVPGFKYLVRGAISQRMKRLMQYYFLFSFGLIALDLLLKLGPFIQGNFGVIGTAALCNGLILIYLLRTRNGVITPQK